MLECCMCRAGLRLASQAPTLVAEWQMVTVASRLLSSRATGMPTMFERPICSHAQWVISG
jgi:hypothetical protein